MIAQGIALGDDAGRRTMETLEGLKRKIHSAQELQGVVRTMKALAAVSIRQFEKAVESLAHYNRTILLALRVAIKRRSGQAAAQDSAAEGLGALIFGSDQGMCGQLNEQIVAHAAREIDATGVAADRRTILVVGERAAARLEAAGERIDEVLPAPSALAGVTPSVQEVLLRILDWRAAQGIDHVMLFYSELLGGASYEPRTLRLLPVDRAWLDKLQREPWPTHVLPTFSMDWDALFSALIRQYLFVSLYRAFAESLASENASRLAAMQNAERNIDERLGQLQAQFHQQRQMTITEELLDIVSGFEALKEDTR